MNVDRAIRDARVLMNMHGLTGWTLQFNSLKYSAGRTKYSTRTISLSRPIVALWEPEQVRDTVLHEIAHALVGQGHGHDDVWRRMALSIGCDGKAKYSATEHAAVPAKWTGTCSEGHTYHRHRLTARARSGSCHYCRLAGRKGKTFPLSWVDNTAYRAYV